MNVFKSLDSLFPTGKARRYGEVVGVSLRIQTVTDDLSRSANCSLWFKRKAWYVNASVNAFHMHRGLIREFMSDHACNFPKSAHRSIKRQIALCIFDAYLRNYVSGNQGSEYVINIKESSQEIVKTADAWYVLDTEKGNWLEIYDDRVTDLRTVIGRAVDNFVRYESEASRVSETQRK